MVCSTTFAACGGDDNDDKPVSQVTITCQPETINASAEGGSFTVEVSTTGTEWGAYTESKWIEISTRNTVSKQGTILVVVTPNPTTEARIGSIKIMSGSGRKTIEVSQRAAEKAAYDAPEGYSLVWHDEFNSGTELNPDDWTHEVKNSGWVNNELQNYVNHKTPDGNLVTEVKNGSLHIKCLKENGKIYSGRVYAKVKEGWTYGYIEASIKLPKGKGTWPAFWMMPVNFRSWPADGEIDIMEEVGYHPNYVSSSLHANAHVHSNGTQVTHEIARAPRASSTPMPSFGPPRTSPLLLTARFSSVMTTVARAATTGLTTTRSTSSSTSPGVETGAVRRVLTKVRCLPSWKSIMSVCFRKNSDIP